MLSSSIIVSIILSFSIIAIKIDFSSYFGTLSRLSILLILLAGGASLALFFYVFLPEDRVAVSCLCIFLFFSIVLIYKLYLIYLNRGCLGAMHGRYFYPVIPSLLLFFSIALKRLKVPVSVIATCVFIMACMELEVFLLQVLPFYFEKV